MSIKIKTWKSEPFVQGMIWLMVFLIPLYKLLTSTGSMSAAWNEIFSIWLHILPFFILFLIHHFLILPQMVDHDRKALYFCLVALLLAAFAGYTILTRRPPEDLPDFRERNEMIGPPGGERSDRNSAPPRRSGETFDPGDGHLPEGRKMDKPMRPFSPEIIKMLGAIAILGFDFLIKGIFKGAEDERKMQELKEQNLQNQLQYLRYQISPHFFMNTLNNIHALVDIDPEQAKDSIVQLSKLMRYVLYEGNKPTIPLIKEISFLKQYISLMRLRYNDSVKITDNLPEEVPNVEIPPLMFISFVENAFKHGVSYESESFITVGMKIANGRLAFKCENSIHDQKKNSAGGIGMTNTKTRLDLLYGKDYTLNVSDVGGVYSIYLDIPTKSSETTEEV